MKVAEQSNRELEHEELWDNFRKQHELYKNDHEHKIKVFDARMDRLEHLFEVSRIENDKRVRELFAMFAEH